mgnify:CR=1 FL=1
MILYTAVSYLISAVLLPIIIKVRAFAELKNAKIFYSLYLFGFIRIDSGYIGFADNRFILHYSDKKAVVVKYKNLLPDKRKTELLLHFNFVRIHTNVLIGGADEFIDYYAASLINSVNAVIYSILKGTKRYTDYRCDVYLSENEDIRGVLTEVSIVFNIVSLIEIATKKIFGGIISNGKRN